MLIFVVVVLFFRFFGSNINNHGEPFPQHQRLPPSQGGLYRPCAFWTHVLRSVEHESKKHEGVDYVGEYWSLLPGPVAVVGTKSLVMPSRNLAVKKSKKSKKEEQKEPSWSCSLQAIRFFSECNKHYIRYVHIVSPLFRCCCCCCCCCARTTCIVFVLRWIDDTTWKTDRNQNVLPPFPIHHEWCVTKREKIQCNIFLLHFFVL